MTPHMVSSTDMQGYPLWWVTRPPPLERTWSPAADLPSVLTLNYPDRINFLYNLVIFCERDVFIYILNIFFFSLLCVFCMSQHHWKSVFYIWIYCGQIKVTRQYSREKMKTLSLSFAYSSSCCFHWILESYSIQYTVFIMLNAKQMIPSVAINGIYDFSSIR